MTEAEKKPMTAGTATEPEKQEGKMLKNLREALCFMDLKKRMSGQCQQPDITETEADFLLHQIRTLS